MMYLEYLRRQGLIARLVNRAKRYDVKLLKSHKRPSYREDYPGDDDPSTRGITQENNDA